jgi:UDP-N-acetylmuramoyl-tripeptide--D-alanyl-D-alanine ligase
MRFTLAEIADMCHGKLFGDGSIIVTGFFTDSRKFAQGQMFIPIKGEQTDGHRFIDSVIASGCRATFSEIELGDRNINYVLVGNTIDALQRTAARYRSDLNIPVIGITGSVGKTSAKEMIALALSSSLNVYKTKANANSQIGLPISVLGISDDNNAAVLEMGMSLPGEMSRISAVARPGYAVFTNIGVSHIEFHGTKEKILEQKLHITDYFSSDSILFINGDDKLLCTLKSNFPYRIITYGLDNNCNYRADNIAQDTDKTTFTCITDKQKRVQISLPVQRIHNVRNALASIAVADVLGLDLQRAAASLASYTVPKMRQEVIHVNGITVIDDTYNASPDSMYSSLDMLSQNKCRKIAVLSDMLELGKMSGDLHRSVGEYAIEKTDYLLVYGNDAKYIYDGFDDSSHSKFFSTSDELWDFLDNFIKKDDCILVKGSRGMKTDVIVSRLKEKK